MQEPASHELPAATAPLANGDASHAPVPRRPAPPLRKPAARRAQAPRVAPPAADAAADASAQLAAVFGWHDSWRERMALAAREQLAFLAASGSGLVTLGQAMAAEADHFRRLEIAWTGTQAQMERCLDLGSRLVELMAGTAAAGEPRR
jgi:hypothetical protein